MYNQVDFIYTVSPITKYTFNKTFLINKNHFNEKNHCLLNERYEDFIISR